VAVEGDGRIVVAGGSQGDPGPQETGGGGIGVARFLADGSPAPTFGGGRGTVLLRDRLLREECLDAWPRMAVARDGRIVIAVSGGCEGEAGSLGAPVIRLRSDGHLDRTFGRRGIWHTARICSPPAVAVESDGGVIVAGADDESFSSYCADTATVVDRLTAWGVRDRRFGSRGEVRFRFPGRVETGATDVLIDAHGRIVLAGYATEDADYEHKVYFAAARLHADG
jgi:uncharacterized delta-60 repeat protein